MEDHNEVFWFIWKDMRFCAMAHFRKKKKVDKYELKPQAM
jgi:hypothetical protein